MFTDPFKTNSNRGCKMERLIVYLVYFMLRNVKNTTFNDFCLRDSNSCRIFVPTKKKDSVSKKQ